MVVQILVKYKKYKNTINYFGYIYKCTQSAQISQKQDGRSTSTIMKTKSRLSPRWVCGKSCTWAHNVHLCTNCASCAPVHALPQSHCVDKRAHYLFGFKICTYYILNTYIYYIYLFICLFIYLLIYLTI